MYVWVLSYDKLWQTQWVKTNFEGVILFSCSMLRTFEYIPSTRMKNFSEIFFYENRNTPTELT